MGGREEREEKAAEELTALCVCTYGVIFEYGQRRSYTSSVSEGSW